jgi:Ca-activated chloride channel family protein
LLLLLTSGVGLAARLVPEPKRPPVDAGPDIDAPLHRQTTQDALRFEGRLDRGAVHVGGDGLVHLELIATGAKREDRALVRRPTDVVVVLDRSGSMGGDPMTKALAAIRELLGQLGQDDRFALVSYSNGAELTLPLETASFEARMRWTARLESIAAGGGTNMSAGLDRAHALMTSSSEAGRVGRVILLSDGHANQGDSSPDGLARRASRAVRTEYVLSTVGVGVGFDERLMTRLADAGTGNFYYVPQVDVLAGIFADEFAAARETVASVLEIRIGTPDAVQLVDAAGYPIERQPAFSIIRPGSLFAGQRRSFWVTLRVATDTAAEIPLGDVQLAYRSADGIRREAKLGVFPAITAVVDETRFVAQLDAEAVEREHAENLVNRLRQRVSGLVSSGDYDAARKSLDEVDYSELEALGQQAEDTASYGAVQRLKKQIERAAEAPAAVQSELRSSLGKSLYEQGTDGRRKGAKR